jgi:oligoribonuclease
VNINRKQSIKRVFAAWFNKFNDKNLRFPMPQESSHLIWIDLEMTGLDPDINTIIEIATLVTDVNLQVLEEGPVLAIHQNDETLAAMDEWNTRQHGLSGLTRRVRQSNITLASAEEQTLAFLRRYVPPQTSPMCGNTVSQDRRFLYRYMPRLESYFHYRHIDVSTLKELAKRWQPQLAEFDKESQHLALSDIYDSIEELKYYRQYFLRAG